MSLGFYPISYCAVYFYAINMRTTSNIRPFPSLSCSFVLALLVFQFASTALAQWASKNNPLGVDTYTEDEFLQIPKLRVQAKDVLTLPHMLENGYLVRFLRVANWNLQEAETKLRENFLWRKKINLDEGVNQKFFQYWQRRFPYYINYDRQGRPGFVSSLINLDVRQLVASNKADDYYKYYMHMIERTMRLLPQVSNSTGKEFMAVNVLYNDAGLNARQHACFHCIPFMMKFMQTFDVDFPMGMNSCITINAPRIYETLFAIIKPTLSDRTVSIIKPYGVDKSEWKAALLKKYSADQLTIEFGGTVPQLRSSNIQLPGNHLLSPK